MTRILHWTELAPPFVGGIETMVSELGAAQVERGHEVALVTNGGAGLPEADEIDGIRVLRLPMRESIVARDPARIAAVAARARAVLRELRPEVVHLHNVSPSALFLSMAEPNAPLVLTMHGEAPATAFGAGSFGRKVLDRAACVTAVSDAVARALEASIPTLAGRIRVIPNAVGWDGGGGESTAQDRATLLVAGRFSPEKGFDLAVRALPLVRERVPAARLDLLGTGPERAALEAQTEAAGVRDAVRFLGAVRPRDVHPHLLRATVVLVPSRAEGFGLVAAEAARAGRAVVAARVGGLPEVVVEGVTGSLFPPEDVGALAAHAVTLLEDPTRRISFERAALERSRARSFDPRAALGAWEDVYRRVSAGTAKEGSEWS